MAHNPYLLLPSGESVHESNRYGGDRGRSDKDRSYHKRERQKALRRTLDTDFAEVMREIDIIGDAAKVWDTVEEPESVWTVLEPESRKFRTRTIIIEAEAELAICVYAARNNGRHPQSVGCDCGCGSDYWVSEFRGTLRVATAEVRHCDVFDRDGEQPYTLEADAPVYIRDRNGFPPPIPRPRWGYESLADFLAREDVEVIREEDITEEERTFPTPEITGPWMYTEEERTLAWVFDVSM